jgi:acyl-coenzyme A synthetase/AMP-(fatty) acid ligase
MLVSRIYEHAKETPDKTAMIFNGGAVSYRQFASLIQRSRDYLTAHGVGGEGIAVLPTPPIVDTWVLSLALRSLGLTAFPSQEPDTISLPEVRYLVVIAGPSRPDLIRLCVVNGWRLVEVPPAIYNGFGSEPVPEVKETERLGGHILLTSGTTGDPKKFLVDPAAEPILIRHRQKFLDMSARSVVNVFDYALWTVGGYNLSSAVWDAGGAVVIDQRSSAWESFLCGGITDAVVTPHHLSRILSAPADAYARDDAMRLFVGAGALSAPMAEAAKARLTSQIFTHIACTEASSYALTRIDEPEDLSWHRIFPGREVQVVDEHDRVLPSGQSGMVRIRLLAGSAGYLDDEAATHAFFRDGYFYPGDLGVFREDGRLALLGRATEVINILGNKIAVGPIEGVLQRKLQVSGVCVLSFPNQTSQEEVHVVIESTRRLQGDVIAAALNSALPIKRVRVTYLDVLPRNEMGKIQRDVVQRTILSTS